MLYKPKPKRKRRRRRQVPGFRLVDIDERSLRGIRCRTRIYKPYSYE